MIEISQLCIAEATLGTRDAGRADHIDKAISMFVDESDTLLTCLWSNHHDDADIISVSNRLYHFQIIIKWKVWNDSSTHTTFYTTLEEIFYSVVHDRIQISHQNKWQLHIILDSFQLSEKLLHGHSILQSLGTSTLNDRTISQRITEWDSYLYHIYSLALHRLNHITRSFEGWATSTEIQAQKLAVFIVCKQCIYLIHNTLFFLYFQEMSSTSPHPLSPAPSRISNSDRFRCTLDDGSS